MIDQGLYTWWKRASLQIRRVRGLRNHAGSSFCCRRQVRGLTGLSIGAEHVHCGTIRGLDICWSDNGFDGATRVESQPLRVCLGIRTLWELQLVVSREFRGDAIARRKADID